MIAKKHRLKEKEVKRVLAKWKPFFSYNIVLNSMKNHLWYNRFAIVIWAKSVKNNVERNYFRRYFYDMVNNKCEKNGSADYVFVIKKKSKFDKKERKSIISFENDLKFLVHKWIQWKKS